MNDLFSVEHQEDIIIISFNNIKKQKYAMTGISSFYEDPKFKNKYLSKNKLFKKYLNSINYKGHNCSVDKLIEYLKLSLSKDDILDEEKKLYEELIGYFKKNKYVITTTINDNNTLDHELMHAKYHYDNNYKKFVKTIWNGITVNTKNVITKYLDVYHESIHEDEFQAYITTTPFIFFKSFSIKKNKFKKIKKEILKLSKLLKLYQI